MPESRDRAWPFCRDAVEVAHAGVESTINAGDEFTTTQNLAPEPVSEQVAWSPNRDQYIELLAQFSTLQHRIEQIPIPQRYGSDLLDRMPGETQLYVSIPNLGDFVSQAKAIFEDQLKQSPVLQQWWTNGKAGQDRGTGCAGEQGARSEPVSRRRDGDRGAEAADGQRDLRWLPMCNAAGWPICLKQQFVAESHGALTVLDESALHSASGGKQGNGAYALVGAKEVIFSNSIDTLKTIDAQLNAGSSGFAASDFGQRIKAAYDRGAGVILAANLQQMLAGAADSRRQEGRCVSAGVGHQRTFAT